MAKKFLDQHDVMLNEYHQLLKDAYEKGGTHILRKPFMENRKEIYIRIMAYREEIHDDSVPAVELLLENRNLKSKLDVAVEALEKIAMCGICVSRELDNGARQTLKTIRDEDSTIPTEE